MGAFDDLIPADKKAGGGAFDDLIPKKQEAAKDEPSTFIRALGGAIEPMITMGTGAAGAVAGGIGGIGQSIYNALGIGDKRTPTDVSQSIASRLTYQPRSEGGKTAMGAFSAIPEAIHEKIAQPAGAKVQDITGSPGLAAQTSTLFDFLPQLAASKGAGMLKKPPAAMNMTPEVAELARRKVTMTPGQIGGPQWAKAESAVERIPLIGAPIKAAKTRGLEEMQRSSLQDSLTPIGEKLPDKVKGRDAVAFTQDRLGERYDDLQSKMTGSLHRASDQGPPDVRGPGGGGPWPPPEMGPTLSQDLNRITSQSTLPVKWKKELERIIDTEITSQFDKKSGLADGETIKKIESQLTGLIKSKKVSSNQYEREQALALVEARKAFREMLGRDNPQFAQDLQTLNGAYAKFKIAQTASVKGREGVPTPAQFESAVKKHDTSKDKSKFARGEALQQPLATAGRNVLSDYLPDSGTPYQLALIGEILGGAVHSAKLLGASALSPLIYSRPGLAGMQRLLTNPPRGAGVAGAQALPFGAANQTPPIPPQ